MYCLSVGVSAKAPSFSVIVPLAVSAPLPSVAFFKSMFAAKSS